jgi:hypothetical protein
MSVMICTPTRARHVSLSYVIGLMSINGAYGGWMPMGGQGDIHIARTTLANLFLKTKHEAMIFIDDDIGFSRNDYLELVASDNPYVSGLYPGKSDPMEFIFRDKDMKTVAPESLPKTGLIEVGLIPTGFLKVHRCVFEKIVERGLAQPFKRGEMHHYFPSSVVDDYIQSEDYSFCNLAKQAGFPPVINCAIRLEHDGRRIR